MRERVFFFSSGDDWNPTRGGSVRTVVVSVASILPARRTYAPSLGKAAGPAGLSVLDDHRPKRARPELAAVGVGVGVFIPAHSHSHFHGCYECPCGARVEGELAS